MKVALGIVGGLVIGGAVGWGVAQNYLKTQGGGASPDGAAVGECTVGGAADTASAALFELDGETYTRAALPDEVGAMLYEIDHQSYERIAGLLKQFALRLALAKEKDPQATAANLPPLENLLEVGKPTEEELKKIFDENKDRMPPGMTFDQVRKELEQYMTNQKLSEALRQKMAEIEGKDRFELLLKEPVAPVVELDLAGFPAKGPKSAPVTLVEASDYLCPHCQQTYPEVEGILQEFGDKLRFVQVNFALRPQNLSGSLIKGAWCAQQQSEDLFWKYHDQAFAEAKTKGWKMTDAAATEPVLAIAKEIGADTAKLETCLASEEASQAIEQAAERMEAAGVTGTPSFFLNGRKVDLHGGKRLKDVVGGAVQSSH